METRPIRLKTQVVLLDPHKHRPIGRGRVTGCSYDSPMRYGVTLVGKNKPEPDVTANELRPIDE